MSGKPHLCCTCAGLPKAARSTATPTVSSRSAACPARCLTSRRASEKTCGTPRVLRPPRAPAPNSLVVATSAVVTDDHSRILLQRRTSSGTARCSVAA
jgi:hypothetical protein